MKTLIFILAAMAGLTVSFNQPVKEAVFGAPTVLQVYQGGTGATSFTAGLCLIGNGTGALTTGACGTGTSDWQIISHFSTSTLTPTTSISLWAPLDLYVSNTLKVQSTSTFYSDAVVSTTFFVGATPSKPTGTFWVDGVAGNTTNTGHFYTGTTVIDGSDGVDGVSVLTLRRKDIPTRTLSFHPSGSGAIPTMITDASSIRMEQTGGAFGATSLTLLNGAGQNGALFTNSGLELVDFQFRGPSNTDILTIRWENRGSDPRFEFGTAGSPSMMITDRAGNLQTVYVNTEYTPIAKTTGIPTILSISPANNTGLTASAYFPQFRLASSQQLHLTGGITTQADVVLFGSGHGFVSASTIENYATLYITPPIITSTTLYANWDSIFTTGSIRIDQRPLILSDGVSTSSYFASSTIFNKTAGFNMGKFNIDASGNLSASGTASVSGGNAGKATCWKADGKTIGYCSSVVDIAGACTCN